MAVKLKGDHCLAVGAFFSLASLVLQMLIHISQASATVGHSTSMVSINLQSLQASLGAVWGNDTIRNDLYNITYHAPLGESLGMRHEYRWGLYKYCGYILTPFIYGSCSNTTFPRPWTPFEVLVEDAPPQYFVQINEFIVESLRNSAYLGSISRIAFYLILLSLIATVLVIPLGCFRSTLTFLFAATLSCISAAALLVAASMWTAVVLHAQATNRTQTGIIVNFGVGVWLLWATFATSLMSVLPYVLSSWSYRRYRFTI